MENDNELDSFDLDLLDLISSDLNTTNQYLVFEGSNCEVYAINISKVIEVLVYKKLEMVKNGNGCNLIRATATIRDEISTIICFDEWFGNDILNEEDYEFVVLAGFGGQNLAIMVKNVEYIISMNPKNMKDNSINNPKTNFISKIKLNGKDRLCTVFDSDKLLLDVFEENYKANSVEKVVCNNDVNTSKLVLFADDSRYIRNMVHSLFDKMNLNSKIFENGKELLDELKLIDPNEIGLIITDLEMPLMDGKTLIKEIKNLETYNGINIIVHTNMSNFIIESSLIELGIKEVINKIDIEKLRIGINKYLRS